MVVPYDAKAISLLKDQDNWWSVTFVGSFVSLYVHCCENKHRDDVLIIPRWCPEEEWDTIEIDSNIKKIIVLQLTSQHYTMAVFNLENKTVMCYNGFNRKINSRVFKANDTNLRSKTISGLLEAASLGPPRSWTHVDTLHLRQTDNSSCGPILLLAFCHEYSGQSLFQEKSHTTYDTWMRRRLVDIHFELFNIANCLGLLIGHNQQGEVDNSWDQNSSNAKSLPASPSDTSTPPKDSKKGQPTQKSTKIGQQKDFTKRNIQRDIPNLKAPSLDLL